MQTFELNYFISFFTGRMKIGAIEIEATDINEAQDRAMFYTLNELKEKTQDDDFLEGIKEITITI
jgi:hypothetical protein